MWNALRINLLFYNRFNRIVFEKKRGKVNMDIVLLALIIAVTIMFSISRICDVFEEIFRKNRNKGEKYYENTKSNKQKQ